MKTTTKILVALVAIALFDTVIPIPLAALVLIYVLGRKPAWFKDLVYEVYGP